MTINPFLTPGQVRSIQKLVLQGMQSDVLIYRRTPVAPTTGSDYGDDDIEFNQTRDSLLATTKGWLFSTPTPVQVIDAGQTVTINTYRLFLPVGTDVQPGDNVVIGNESYTVSDTTSESTWPAALRVSLRLPE